MFYYAVESLAVNFRVSCIVKSHLYPEFSCRILFEKQTRPIFVPTKANQMCIMRKEAYNRVFDRLSDLQIICYAFWVPSSAFYSIWRPDRSQRKE